MRRSRRLFYISAEPILRRGGLMARVLRITEERDEVALVLNAFRARNIYKKKFGSTISTVFKFTCAGPVPTD